MQMGITRREDLCFFECTPHYPILRLREALKDTRHLLFVKDGPELHGWPHRRKRVLAAGVNKQTLQWVGPKNDKDIVHDYSMRFYKASAVSGSIP